MRYSMVLGLAGLVAVNAHPERRQANDFQLTKAGLDVQKYALPRLSSYTSDVKVNFVTVASDSYVDTATSLVKEVVPSAEFRVVEDDWVDANGVAHVNFRQTAHGLDIDNADFNVNIKDGKVLSYGNSFYTGKLPQESPLKKRDFADPVVALKGAIDVLGLPVQTSEETRVAAGPFDDSEAMVLEGTTGAVSDPSAKLVYIQKGSDKDLTLTWRVETDILHNWLLTYVNAASGKEVHGVVDYTSDHSARDVEAEVEAEVADVSASYQVYPWGINDPSEGERQVVKDPWFSTSSEFTWVGDGKKDYTTTRGNNGVAHDNPKGSNSWENQYRPDSKDRKFEYPFSLEEKDQKKYKDASITQLFYTANKLHDLLYVLGFTEKAGNFEVNNNNQGGKGNDLVILNTQFADSRNNAQFSTPPDGQSGRMMMFMWDKSSPMRDSSFEAGVVIHEYVHGLSNRLTGGPANAGCLNDGESGGMGEGWGDFFATMIRLKKDDTRDKNYAMGAWVFNNEKGIRKYPYSTSTKTNPLTFKNVDDSTRVHDIGTIWATILYEVAWNLIDKHGKNDADMPKLDEKGKPDDGKYLAMKLVLDGMALQPCNPSFIAARDAILDADKALTGGENKCELWKGFAKRGMGAKATGENKSSRKEDFTLPEGC